VFPYVWDTKAKLERCAYLVSHDLRSPLRDVRLGVGRLIPACRPVARDYVAIVELP
jgi:hypothetical protein